MREAEQFAEEDRKLKEKAEARNMAETMAYTTKKTLDDLGDKVSAQDRESIEKVRLELEELLKGDDIEKIKQKTEELSKAVYEVTSRIYQKQAEESKQQTEGSSQGPGQESTPGGGDHGKDGGDGGYVDANYKIVDDK